MKNRGIFPDFFGLFYKNIINLNIIVYFLYDICYNDVEKGRKRGKYAGV